jgi:hypothetical protein
MSRTTDSPTSGATRPRDARAYVVRVGLADIRSGAPRHACAYVGGSDDYNSAPPTSEAGQPGPTCAAMAASRPPPPVIHARISTYWRFGGQRRRRAGGPAGVTASPRSWSQSGPPSRRSGCDDTVTPVAAYVRAYWEDGHRESWAPMRQIRPGTPEMPRGFLSWAATGVRPTSRALPNHESLTEAASAT